MSECKYCMYLRFNLFVLSVMSALWAGNALGAVVGG